MKFFITVHFSFTLPNEIAKKYIAVKVCNCKFTGCLESSTQSFYLDRSDLLYKCLTLRHKLFYVLYLNAWENFNSPWYYQQICKEIFEIFFYSNNQGFTIMLYFFVEQIVIIKVSILTEVAAA